VDANVVMRAPTDYVEVQGTGDQGVFSRPQFGQLLDLAEQGIGSLFQAQRQVLGL
jgi:ribonuclease PH